MAKIKDQIKIGHIVWETITEPGKVETYRIKVFGGWLVSIDVGCGDSRNYTTTFVPDPKHEWVLANSIDVEYEDDN